jgi:predicted RND superfamily exporter protein
LWFQESFRSFLQDIRSDESEEVEVLYFATPLFWDEFLSILLQDMLLALIAVVFVFLCVWFHTGSFFLAAVGMVEILLSIPMAFVIYRAVFGLQYFAAINSMTLFVVLAIGADDIFVLMDAYHQSLYDESVCASFQKRMTWVYRRAAGAMFVTSFTTMAAFVASGTSTLVDVQSFGIFAAFVIFVDFVLVITWFPACLVWYHNNLESWNCCCRRAFTDKSTSTERARKMWLEPQEARPVQKKRLAEQFLGGPFASFVVKRRALILGFFAIISACAAAGGAQIRPATSSEQFLPSSHPFQRIFDIMNDEFPSSSQDANAKVYLTWGLADVDRSSVNLLMDETNKGSLVYDKSFSFDEAAQLYVLKVCEEVYQYSSSVSGFLSIDPAADVLVGKVDCPLFDFKAWLEAQDKSFPVPFDEVGSTLVAFLNAPVPDATDASQNFNQKWKRYLGYKHSLGQLRFITIGVESNLREKGRDTHDTLEVQYNLFEGWVDTLNRQGPRSANGAFHVAANSMWVWMHTQTVFVSSAITGMISGAVLAFVVVLCATQQILVAFASLLTILGVLTSVLGSMVALGWELGTIESICLTILAGFSVDYVVHLAHAFVHADKKDRADKVRTALDEIGISVLFGMLTSASAAFALMACQIQFFHKFGVFLLMTVSISWLWANISFMASMAVFGPDDQTPEWLQFPAPVIRRMAQKKATQAQTSTKACQKDRNSQKNNETNV